MPCSTRWRSCPRKRELKGIALIVRSMRSFSASMTWNVPPPTSSFAVRNHAASRASTI